MNKKVPIKTSKRKKPSKKTTSKKQSQNKIIECCFDFLNSSKSSRCILDSLGDEIYLLDSNGKIVFANRKAIEALGYARKDIVSAPFVKFLKNGFTIKKWKETHLRELKKKKRPINYVAERSILKDCVQTVEVSAVYLNHESKEYVLTCVRDITEKTILEKRLKASEELYRTFTEQAADAIFTADLKGRIVYANSASEKLTKIPLSDAKGVNYLHFIEKNSWPKAKDTFMKVRKGVPVLMGEMDILDKDKKIIPVEFTTTPIYKNRKIVQIHTIFRDIGKKKQCQKIVHEAEKVKAIQQFIAGTAQEIQNPLKAVHNSADNLISRYKDRDYEYIGYKEFLDIIQTLTTMRDQLKYCCDTNKRLLGMHKKRAGFKKKSCDPNSVVKDVLKTLKHHLEFTEIKVKANLSGEIKTVLVDEVELTQIVMNVVTNAIQSLTRGGKVEIKTQYIKKDAMVCIQVKDNGEGIPVDILPRVFDPFFTTKTRGLEKNSGLGLSIVQSIVKSVKGDIDIFSSIRKGTTVRVFLPIVGSGVKNK